LQSYTFDVTATLGLGRDNRLQPLNSMAPAKKQKKIVYLINSFFNTTDITNLIPVYKYYIKKA
jgi:hypothetical protein